MKGYFGSGLFAALTLGVVFSSPAYSEIFTQSTAQAGDAPAPSSDEGKASGFYPNLEIEVVYDDNITLLETGEVDSIILEARPELMWVGEIGKHKVQFGYRGYYAWYDADSAQNFDDHFLGGDISLDLSRQLDVKLGADFRHEHEARSVATTTPGSVGPNIWEQWAASGAVIYGRREAKAQVGFAAEHYDREYTNNGQEWRDHTSNDFKVTLYYNLGPKTQLLLEPRFARYEYGNFTAGAPNLYRLDNDVKSLLAGVTWNATAKTTGEFKLGYQEKEYDDAAGPGDTSGLSVEGKVIWKPKTYTKVTGVLSRSAYDSALGGGSQSYVATLVGLDWQHDVSNLTQLQAGFQLEKDEYDVTREDDLASFYLGASYALKRWLTVGARYDFTKRDSNAVGGDFTDNRIEVGFKTTMK